MEEHVANVALQLRELGHEVVIWAADQNDDVPTDFRGIRLRYLPTPLPARALRPALRFLHAGPRAWRAWRQAQREDRPDILHNHCFGPNGMWATALAQVTRTPLVLSHHGETFGDADGVFEQSALLRAGLRSGLRRAAAVTSCSRFGAEDLSRFGIPTAQVEVVFNGVHLDEPADGALPGFPERFVLGVGRLVGNKGFDQLIRAFATIADTPAGLGTDLVIGGDGPHRETLAELARAAGLADRVHLVGRLSRPQVGAAMAAAHIVVVPSAVEAFGITVLEGWRAGVPVLATRRGGPPEFMEDGVTGILIDPEDADTMGQRIAELLTDEPRRRAIGRAGAEAVDQFTWERTAQKYHQMYQHL